MPDKDGAKSGEGGYSHDIGRAGLGLIVMAISLTIIVVMYVEFGHIGSKFSTNVLQKQQQTLRSSYGLPSQPPVSPQEAEIPPSLRNLTNSTQLASTNSTNSTR